MMRKIFIILAIAGCSLSAMGQADQTLYNIRSIPQSVYLNPAIIPHFKVNIGLPAISSIYANVFNDGFSYKDVLSPKDDSTMLFTPDVMLSKMGKKNLTGLSFNIDLLHVGFRAGKNYIHFNWTEKFNTRLTLPRDFVRTLWSGNGYFLGETADWSGLGIDMEQHHEFAFGWARPVTEKLTVGGSAKLLWGTYNINMKRNDLTVFTDSNNYFLTVGNDIEMNTSGLPNLLDSADMANFQGPSGTSDFLFGHNNVGFGVDLGATYQVNEKFQVSASLLDLGFIKWKYQTQNYTNQAAEFQFQGLVIDDLPPADSLGDYIDSLAGELLDNIAGTFDLDTSSNAYTTGTSPKINIGANFYITESMDAALLLGGEIWKGSLRPSVTASFNARLNHWLSASASWSYLNRSIANIGFGLRANLGPMQLYVVSDNILSPLIPQSVRTLQIHTGLNLAMGRAPKDRDEDGIVDKEDMCPDDPGLPEFAGCPDRDGDKIIDKDDACPDVPGVPMFSGCPDTDNDQVVDSLDKCPTTPGLKEFEGCPDRDGDKITDAEDACPDEAGPRTTKGCPDKDGDTVIDKEDVCVDKFGPVDHKGCPDSDGDGLYDNEDRCPEKFGPVANIGCPYGDLDGDGVIDKEDRCVDTPGRRENAGCPWGDIDADGVIDNQDSCPRTPGPKENNGCPVIAKEEQEVLNTAFKNLEFESGKAIIKPTSYPSLDSLASLLIKKAEWKLRISGHTDNVGLDAANMLLSKNRSNAVKDYLVMKGVPPENKFIVEWFGETKPVYPNDTPEGRQKNRRVEMKVEFE